MVDSIAEGTTDNVAAVGEKLRSLEKELADLDPIPSEADSKVEWHPNAAKIYKKKLGDLQIALNADDLTREQATTALRGLIDKIVALPAEKPADLELELHGHLAEALKMTVHVNSGGGASA